MNRHYLPFVFLLVSTSLGSAATLVAPPAIAPAAGERSGPALVAHGSGYVALWLDANGVVVARLDEEGRLTGATPSLLATRPYFFGWADDPALASNGRTLLAAWTCGPGKGEICTGVIDPVTLAVRPGPTLPGRDPAVAWSGSSWAVVSYDYPSYGVPSFVRVAWLREDGELAATFHVGEGSDPAVASTGTATVVAWRSDEFWYGPIRIRRVSEGGPVGEARDLSSSDAYHPLLATDGDGFLAVWTRSGPSGYASAVPLTPAGEPAAVPVPLATPGPVESLAWDGRDYVAGVNDGYSRSDDPGDAHLMYLSSSGSIRRMQALAAGTGGQRSARIASNGATAVAAWVNWREARFDQVRVPSMTIETARVEPDRPPPPSTVISTGASAQVQPAVAGHASKRLAAWTELSAGIGRVRFTLFDTALAPVGPAGRAARETTSDQRFPAVATDGSGFLLAWTETEENAVAGSLYGVLVSPAGEAGAPFLIAQHVAHSPLALAHDGTSYYVVWTAHDDTLAAAHVTAAGSVVEPSPIGFGESGFNPTIAWSGSSILLAWEALAFHPECRITCAPVSRIRAVPLAADGSRAAGAARLELDWTEHPVVIWAGSTFVLFTDNHYYPRMMTVSRFTSEGTPLEPAAIPVRGDHPAAGYDGASILLLWSDLQSVPFRMSLTPELG
ncbi:MAG TPA: hypothetical protein VGE86_06440, partial [Thermoanaerobaculia bacterium]